MSKTVGLLAGHNVDAIKDKVNTEPFSALFARMQETVAAAIAADREADKIPCRGWCHSLYFTPMVVEAGFLYTMTGNEDCARHVERQIDKLARVYADPPASFDREIEGFGGKPSAYFSNAHTALAARICWDGMTPDYRDRLCELMRTRLIDDCHDPEYFLTHFNAGHNAVTTHVVSAAICALLFGNDVDHPETERLITLGRDACEAHLHWAYDDRGAPHEGPMYSLVTLEWVYFYAELLRRHGREDLFKTQPRLAIIPQACIEMQLPGMVGIPGFDDCRRLIEQHAMPWLLLTADAFGRPMDKALWHHNRLDDHAALNDDRGHRRAAAEWLTVREILWWDGRPPAKAIDDYTFPTAWVGEGKGVGIYRSSWNPDASCLVVLGQGRSHNIPDHTHADAGHISFFSHGELLAYDTGYFNFDEDTHSVVLINDTPFCHATQGNQYAGHFRSHGSHALLDWVTVDAAAAKGCMWADRTVLFIRGEGQTAYAVTFDNINVDNGVHNFKWQLQANLHCKIETSDNVATVTGDHARLDCHFVSPAEEDFPTSPHSLRVWGDDHEHLQIGDKSPESNPRLVAEQEGPNCTLMALVIPRAINQGPLNVKTHQGYRSLVAYVEHGSFLDQIVYACDHTFVRLDDLHASSEMVVIRRNQDGDILGTWTNDGKSVHWVTEPSHRLDD